MTGLSGTGKSTVARRLAQALGATVCLRRGAQGTRRDRGSSARRLGGASTVQSGPSNLRSAPRTGRSKFRAARRSFSTPPSATEQRVDAAESALWAGVQLVLVETVCDEATVAARLAAHGGDSPSDATLSIFRQQLASVKAVSPQVPDGALAIQVDTTAGIVGVLDAVFAGLAKAKIVVPVVPAPQELLSVRNVRAIAQVDVEQKIIAPGSLCPHAKGGILLLVTVVIALGPWILNHSLTGLDRIAHYVVSGLHGDSSGVGMSTPAWWCTL